MITDALDLAKRLSALFSALPQVEAVALGGSRGSGALSTDATSDIDLYVYTHDTVPVKERQIIVEKSGGASQADLDLKYWGPGDEWYHAPSDIEVDIVYFDAAWATDQIDRVIRKHQASQGYTTCYWYTVHQSIVLSDPRGWYKDLQERCAVGYPDELRQAIIALNHPVLRGIIPAYAHQVEKAVRRGDLISVNHRLAALFASYFDILFAFNYQLHPGKKRLIEYAQARCANLPEDMAADIASVLHSATEDLPGLSRAMTRLLDNLDQMLSNDAPT